MNKEKNNKVRKALKQYLQLFDEPNLKLVTKNIGLNYYRLTRWLNGKEDYADKSLRLITNFLKRAEDKQTQLKGINKRIS